MREQRVAAGSISAQLLYDTVGPAMRRSTMRPQPRRPADPTVAYYHVPDRLWESLIWRPWIDDAAIALAAGRWFEWTRTPNIMPELVLIPWLDQLEQHIRDAREWLARLHGRVSDVIDVARHGLPTDDASRDGPQSRGMPCPSPTDRP